MHPREVTPGPLWDSAPARKEFIVSLPFGWRCDAQGRSGVVGRGGRQRSAACPRIVMRETCGAGVGARWTVRGASSDRARRGEGIFAVQ